MLVQRPSFWSPDGTRVVMEAQRNGPGDGESVDGPLVLRTDGSLDFLERAEAPWHPVGWADDQTVLGLTRNREEGPDAVNTGIGIEERSLDGRTGRPTLLRPGAPWRRSFLHQWTAVASPDGSRLAMVEENGRSFPRLHTYSLVDGRERGGPVGVRYVTSCGVSWAGDSPTVPVDVPVYQPVFRPEFRPLALPPTRAMIAGPLPWSAWRSCTT
ncbi:MAG TPA: hypothetical protein VIL54_16875 [Natronosporangium sp.]